MLIANCQLSTKFLSYREFSHLSIYFQHINAFVGVHLEITPRQFEIIEAAGRILTASGVSGLTIKNLAKEMQFSESAIYRHFASKEEIIVAMLNFLADSIDSRLTNVIKSSDPEENFKVLFSEQISFFKKNPHFVVAVFSDGLMEESQLINETLLKLMNVKTNTVLVA